MFSSSLPKCVSDSLLLAVSISRVSKAFSPGVRGELFLFFRVVFGERGAPLIVGTGRNDFFLIVMDFPIHIKLSSLSYSILPVSFYMLHLY